MEVQTHNSAFQDVTTLLSFQNLVEMVQQWTWSLLKEGEPKQEVGMPPLYRLTPVWMQLLAEPSVMAVFVEGP